MKGNDQNMGHPGRAILLDWENYDDYMEKYTPDADDKTRFEFAFKLKNNVNEDHYLMIILPTFGPSQVVAAMRGFNTYLIDHKNHPQELKQALELVADYHVKLIKASFKYGLNSDGIWLVDDLGEQKGPFFGPKMFKKHYESSYKYIIDEAHALGVDVHHHCCGKMIHYCLF
ncbi:MAG: uroporphyrinogen decarboxylase family protein [Candidatus Hodarchaeota archaeon]